MLVNLYGWNNKYPNIEDNQCILLKGVGERKPLPSEHAKAMPTMPPPTIAISYCWELSGNSSLFRGSYIIDQEHKFENYSEIRSFQN